MSLNAAAIRVLVERGLSGDDILAVADALESDTKKSSAAVRQSRYRDRKRNERYVTRDVTPPPIEDNHTPPPSSQPSVSKKERARDLPEDWQPLAFGEATHCGKVISGWPPGEMDRQLEHFRAHHGKKGDKFKDWQKAWATWVLNSEKFGNGQQTRGLQRNAPPPANPLLAAAIRRYGNRDSPDGGLDFGASVPATGGH